MKCSKKIYLKSEHSTFNTLKLIIFKKTKKQKNKKIKKRKKCIFYKKIILKIKNRKAQKACKIKKKQNNKLKSKKIKNIKKQKCKILQKLIFTKNFIKQRLSEMRKKKSKKSEHFYWL